MKSLPIALLTSASFFAVPVFAQRTISDGDATLSMLGTGFTQSVFAAPLGDGTLTTGSGVADQLYKYCWYYQVNGGTNSLMSLIDSPSQSFSGNTGTVSYSNAGPGLAGQSRFDATFVMRLTDGTNPDEINVSCNVTFTSRANAVNSWKLFNLLDLDLKGTVSDDTATAGNPGEITYLDPQGSYARFIATSPSRREVASGFELRGKLNGTTSQLNNSTNSYLGDAAAAYQWDLTLAPGESTTIQTAFSINRSAVFLPVGDSSWAVNGSGNWSAAGNWNGGVPDGSNSGAVFGSAITAASTISLDSPRTVSRVTFANTSRYAIEGASVLSLQATTGTASVTVASGAHTIASPMHFASSTNFNIVSSSDQLDLSGDISSSPGASVFKDGNGTLVARHLRTEGLTISSGVVRISAGTAAATSAGTSRLTSLSIAGGATPTAALDLTNNALVIDYDGATPFATLVGLIKTGRSSGLGILSSTATANTTIGMVEAGELGATSFHNQVADGTAILMAYTLHGDSNLDSQVDSVDFTRFLSGYGATGAGTWSRGDFDYDGRINSLDFNRLAANFGQPLSGSPALGAVVPEPAALSLLAGGMMLACRRRKLR